MKTFFVLCTAALVLAGCDSASSKNTGPSFVQSCEDNKSSGSKSAAIDAPVSNTFNCDKSTRDSHDAPAAKE